MPDLTPQEIESRLTEKAKQFTDEHINNPTETEYTLIHNAMMVGWEMGVRQAIQHMQEHGIVLG